MDASIRSGGNVAGSGELGRVGAIVRSVGTSRQSSDPETSGTDFGRLRVALVHDWLTGMRGGEKCLEVLCKAFPQGTLFTLIHRQGALSPAIEAMTIKTSPLQRIPGIFRFYRHLLPVMPLATKAWRVGDVDLVISLSHCVAKAVRPPAGVPHICYCFTPMRYAWQGRDTYLAGWANRPVLWAVAKRLLRRLRKWDRATSARVTHFVAISHTVKERITRFYGRDSRVIQPPVDTDFYTPAARPQTRDDTYLVVSALVPYKRIEHAINACARLGRRLIVIGSGPERSKLEAIAGPGVTFLGWQPDEVIRDHYRRCRALIFPGDEDFGIVPVEALACGMPVIALGRGGVAETLDDPAIGRTFAEPTVESLFDVMERWEADGSPHDPDRARRRAESFASSVFRERLLGFVSEVVASRDSSHPVPPAPHVAARSRTKRSRRS
jgi:glycosyltransferase involved in cell wall biosynthesis